MQEIFNEVLSKEDEAARIVKEASDRALEIAAEAEKNYQKKAKDAREKSREILNSGLESMRKAQEIKVQTALGDYEKKWDKLQKEGEEKIARLALKLADITASTN